LRRVRVTIIGAETQKVLHVLSMCVCIRVLDIQDTKRMRHIILPSMACLVVLYVSTLSHKATIFGGEKI